MIWEAGPWKAQLLKTAKLVASWRKQKRWTEANFVKVETEVFNGFYAIRKLLDAKTKISFEARDTQVSIRVFAANPNMKVDSMNWHRFEDCYDLTKSTLKQMCLYDLCNCFVHSSVFAPRTSENGGLHSILFNTDRELEGFLYELDTTRLQRIFELIGKDTINQLEMIRDKKSRQWKVLMASRVMPVLTEDDAR